MAMLLVTMGFSPQYVYFEMGIAEFTFQFYTAIKLVKRNMQFQSAVLMGSVGSFFVKSGEKTVIEHLEDEIGRIDSELGVYRREIGHDGGKTSDNVLNKIFGEMAKAGQVREVGATPPKPQYAKIPLEMFFGAAKPGGKQGKKNKQKQNL